MSMSPGIIAKSFQRAAGVLTISAMVSSRQVTLTGPSSEMPSQAGNSVAAARPSTVTDGLVEYETSMWVDGEDASWIDARHAAAERAPAVLPFGAFEQHGPHLPLSTDTSMAVALAAPARRGFRRFPAAAGLFR